MRLALLLVVCVVLVSACELKTGDIQGLKGQEKCDHIDSCAGKSKKQFHCQWWEKSDKRELNEHIEFLTKKSNKDEQYYEMAKRLLKNGATGAVYNLLHAYPGKQLELGLASTQSTDSQPVVQKAGETLGDFQKRQADQRESAKKTVLDQFLALKGHEQPVDPEHCSCVKFPDNGLPYAWDDKAGFQRFCDFWKWSFRAAGVCVDGKVVAFDESTKKLNTFNCPTKPLTVSKWVVTGSAVSGTQYVRKYKKEDGTLIRAAFDGVDAVGDRKREPSDVDTAVESPSLFTYFTSNGVADDSGRTKTMDSREPVWTGLRVKGAPWTFGEQRWALQQVVGKPNHGYETDEVREINMMAYREDTTRHGKAMEILCPDLDTKKDKEMLALVQEYDDKLRSFEKLSPAKRKQIIAKSKGFLASFLGFIEEDAVQSSLPDNTLSPL